MNAKKRQQAARREPAVIAPPVRICCHALPLHQCAMCARQSNEQESRP